MDLSYLFEHNGKVYQPIPTENGFAGPLPQQDNIVFFKGPEASMLEAAGLPPNVWRVRQLAFDIDQGAVKEVTLTLELRNKKAEREIAAR